MQLSDNDSARLVVARLRYQQEPEIHTALAAVSDDFLIRLTEKSLEFQRVCDRCAMHFYSQPYFKCDKAQRRAVMDWVSGEYFDD
jgi:hypothetical protein